MNWHRIKGEINKKKQAPVFFQEREIWFVSLGANVGFEQDGKGNKFLRPVLILKKFNNFICWCVPVSESLKSSEYYFQFISPKGKVNSAIISQLRLIDAKRLLYRMGFMKKEDFGQLKRKLTQLLA